MPAIQIPDECGVMLLPDCTLFPHGGLPLFIFEPRYRLMLEQALAGDFLFAVGRLRGEETQDAADCCSPIGTLGLIRASHEQDDGTSRLLLHGVARVRFVDWPAGRDFPSARIQPLPAETPSTGQSEAMVLHLRDSVEEAARAFPPEVRDALESLVHRTDDPAILADIISQHLLQDPDDRQRVLEMESLADRVAFLCEHLPRQGG